VFPEPRKNNLLLHRETQDLKKRREREGEDFGSTHSLLLLFVSQSVLRDLDEVGAVLLLQERRRVRANHRHVAEVARSEVAATRCLPDRKSASEEGDVIERLGIHDSFPYVETLMFALPAPCQLGYQSRTASSGFSYLTCG